MNEASFDPIDVAAAGWLARMDRGDWSDADEASLQAWLAENPRHQGVLLQAQSLWSAFDTPVHEMVRDDPAEPAPFFTRRRLLAGGGSALAASLAGFLIMSHSEHYSTGIGEIRSVPMPDGSLAAINTDSAIEISLKDKKRELRLTAGEAWFQVAKDKTRPFVVEAGRVRVEAVGTAFSVRRREAGADVLVTEGVVHAWADGAEGNVVRLTAGQRAYIADNAAIRRQPAAPSEVDRTLAWRGGKIHLAGDTLADAAAEFNRYNRRQIRIADPAIAAEQFDGLFGANDPIGFATAVHDSLAVPIDLSDPAAIVIGKAQNRQV